MPLDQFFDLYSLISGRTVLRPNQLAIGQGAASITLKAQTDWTRKEAVFAMDSALALNNVAMIPLEEKFVKAVPIADAPTQGAQLGKVSPGGFTDTEQFVTQVIELKALKPSDMAQLLSTFTKTPNGITPFDNNNTLVIRDYASNVKRMLGMIEKVDMIKEPDYTLEVIPIKYGKVEDFYNTMSSLISGGAGAGYAGAGAAGATGAGATGARRPTSRLGASRLGAAGGMGQSGYGGGGYGGGGYGGAGYGGGGYGGGGYGGVGGRYTPQAAGTTPATSVGGAQGSFQNRLQQIVSRAARGGAEEVQLLEDARIIPDARANTLLIYANKRDMVMITNVVAKLDTLLAQVLIEAVVFEVTLGDSLNLGVSIAQNPRRFGKDFTGAGAINNGQGFLNSFTNFPGAAPTGFSYFGKIGQDFDVTLQAIAENNTINVVSRPRIQTSHAISGTFFVGETIPYSSGTDYYSGFYSAGASPVGRSIVNYLPVGFELTVTPFITPEGYVVMEISQNFSTHTRDVVIDNNPIPSVAERSAEATDTSLHRRIA